MAGLAVLADDLADALELVRQPLVRGHDLVERVGHLAGEPGLIARQPHGEISVTHRLQRAQQPAQVERSFLGTVPAVGAACTWLTFLWLHQRAPGDDGADTPPGGAGDRARK